MNISEYFHLSEGNLPAAGMGNWISLCVVCAHTYLTGNMKHETTVMKKGTRNSSYIQWGGNHYELKHWGRNIVMLLALLSTEELQ